LVRGFDQDVFDLGLAASASRAAFSAYHLGVP
jgi:hypothetical protein